MRILILRAAGLIPAGRSAGINPAARVILVLVLAAGVGCGGRAIYPVEGTVVWPDGKPATELAGGMVQFDLITDDAKEKVSPHGEIKKDGRYRLTTPNLGSGAPAGKYRVLIMPHVFTEGEGFGLGGKPAPPPVLDQRFQQFDKSKIEVVVEANANTIPIPVERTKKR